VIGILLTCSFAQGNKLTLVQLPSFLPTCEKPAYVDWITTI
jgi:hypothetical protein